MPITLSPEDRGPPCPRCKRISIKLISLTDDGKGRRVCRNCKREIIEKYPNMDYTKMPIKKKEMIKRES